MESSRSGLSFIMQMESDCTMSNRRYGIRSNWLSRVFSRDNTGINNDFGVAARWGGIV